MEILIIIGLILLNGVFSMSEIALVSARKSRLEIDAKKGNKSAQTALDLSNEPDKFLSTIQIGITLIGILTGLYSGEAFAADFAEVIRNVIPSMAPYSITIAKTTIVIIVTYFTLVLGELVPKRIGMNMAENISKIIARPMNFLSCIATPFVWLLSKSTSLIVRILGIDAIEESKITEEEIKAIVKEGYDVGEVQEVEQDIVDRVFNLGDRNVGSIMTHRSDMIWLDINDDVKTIKSVVQQNLYNIYPVVSETLDNIQGVVSLKDLFLTIDTPDFSLKNILRHANYLPENLSVYSALEQFKNAREKYGIISDEFGGIEGIVTLKDIMEALVGQMPEIGDDLELVEREDGSVLLDGQYPFYDFLEHFDMEDLYSEYEYNTLSGLILDILEHIPQTGEKFSWLSFDFEIVDMDGARIDKVLVEKQPD
ncbi:putative hemolysin [Parabacteroides sp. PF5-5]|uniref:hemolysin family protein n=1 Tax=unclassified Parabacteroides TaxID=2649774 RepID=UPI002475888A|nr:MULTISPECIES: hemolysin family protein [unclassified Parabacteroides]MDH6304150.1 putative hemolysin [Parabacteroides sp. PH5-39]MDH6315150.1 putative hemolysin [Parabacteroides sp. PF5-13]MDH6318795.1 putative hemolysin [Parabacteroides sp. PH5-13]MDH6322524.1 putative hemolysin [Parabacteroides sp. PH5-8]MDH6326324.1 putative hemolysin [Parabacteroides sp. PH5-41]